MQMNNLPQNPQSCQTDVRRRADINQEIAQKWELIAEIKSEIIALKKENLLLCDETQRFEETEEEAIISRRPKKTEKRLIGRIHWKEEFKDEDTGQSIWIERSQVVRVNGAWQGGLRITFKYCRWWGLLAQLLTTGTQLNSSALLNGGTSAPLLAIYCWQQLIFVKCQKLKNITKKQNTKTIGV